MEQIDDGGPAFPGDVLEPGVAMSNNHGTFYLHKPVSGMSLRDWFAGQALNGNIASSDTPLGGYADAEALAKNCYTAADAMLAARRPPHRNPEWRSDMTATDENTTPTVTLHDRTFPADACEISGFGGDYEQGCRLMALAGYQWLQDHPDADPQFHGYKGVAGVLMEDNDDAKALSKAMLDAPMQDGDKATTVGEYVATGAMHQHSVACVMRAKKVGWDAHMKERIEHAKQEQAT